LKEEEWDYFGEEVVEINDEDLSYLNLWSGIKKLRFLNKNITELPEFPNGLEYLYCWNTNITEIPKKFYNMQNKDWLRKNNVKMI
jgi:hypothetical protein